MPTSPARIPRMTIRGDGVKRNSVSATATGWPLGHPRCADLALQWLHLTEQGRADDRDRSDHHQPLHPGSNRLPSLLISDFIALGAVPLFLQVEPVWDIDRGDREVSRRLPFGGPSRSRRGQRAV